MKHEFSRHSDFLSIVISNSSWTSHTQCFKSAHFISQSFEALPLYISTLGTSAITAVVQRYYSNLDSAVKLGVHFTLECSQTHLKLRFPRRSWQNRRTKFWNIVSNQHPSNENKVLGSATDPMEYWHHFLLYVLLLLYYQLLVISMT